MRETIYRGVSLLDGQWIYGSLVIEKIHHPNWEDLSKIDYTEEYYINKDIDDFDVLDIKPCYRLKRLKRPPQSWCYVEEV